jgi:hypothetical protein
LASGRYHYVLDGREQDISEPWSIRQFPDGARLIWSERRSPRHGLVLSVQALERGGAVIEFDVSWQQQPVAAVIEARYRLRADSLRVSRSDGAGPEQVVERAVAEDERPLLASPLLRVFVGPVIDRLLALGGVASVVVPFIADPRDRAELLLPRIGERRATLLAAGVPAWDGADAPDSRCCEYQGDQYAPGTRFWLGPDGLLQRYTWDQPGHGRWDVRLK